MTGSTAIEMFETAFLGVLGIAAWQDKKSFSVSRTFLLITGFFALAGRWLLAGSQSTIGEWLFSLLPGVIVFLFGWLSGGQIGAGDGAIVLVMGLWLGYEKTIAILLLAMLLCGIFCGVLLVFKKVGRRTEIPFIPFLLIAYLIGRMIE